MKDERTQEKVLAAFLSCYERSMGLSKLQTLEIWTDLKKNFSLNFRL